MEKVETQALQYEKTANTYVLRDKKGKQLINTDYPAILFDRDSGTLHKHGDYKIIRKIAAEMRAKYARVGAHDMAKDLVIFASRTFPIDELNKCLSVSGYCKLMFERISKQ